MPAQKITKMISLKEINGKLYAGCESAIVTDAETGVHIERKSTLVKYDAVTHKWIDVVTGLPIPRGR